MNVTNNLKLPQYTEEDIFDLQNVNKAYDSIDNAYKEVIDFKNEISKTNVTETITNVTKTIIDEKIADGSLSSTTIEDGTITRNKLANSSVDISELSTLIDDNECYSIYHSTSGNKETVFTATPSTLNGDNKISFLVYSTMETVLTIRLFANNNGGTTNFINEQFTSKQVALKVGYNKVNIDMGKAVDTSFSTYLLYIMNSFNNSTLYFRKSDFYVDGIKITGVFSKTTGGVVVASDSLPYYLVTNKNINTEISNNTETIKNTLETIYSKGNKYYEINYTANGENCSVFTFSKTALESVIPSTGQFKMVIKYLDTTNVVFNRVMLWYGNSLDEGYIANDGNCKIIGNKVGNDGYRTIEVLSPKNYDLSKAPYVKPFLYMTISNSPVKVDLNIDFLFSDKNANNYVVYKQKYSGEHTIEEKQSDTFLINTKTLNSTKEELIKYISENKLPTRWSGVKYLAIGDSITHANGNTVDNGATIIGYQRRIADKLELNLTSFGVGSMAVNGGLRSYFEGTTLDSMLTTNKIISIYMGTNDFGSNQPLGTFSPINSTTFETTFIGSYQFILKKIFTLNPKAIVILFTPTQRSNGEKPNTEGLTLLDYVKAVKELALRSGCYCLDLYGELSLNVNNIETYTIDGLHPNQIGHDLIGEYCANKISQY